MKKQKSLWKRFWSNPYKWGLWYWIGGRPWTFIIRDIYHKFELVWITGLVSLGVYMGHHYDWDVVIKLWLVFCAGYLFGHLFWGKKYIENQQG